MRYFIISEDQINKMVESAAESTLASGHGPQTAIAGDKLDLLILVGMLTSEVELPPAALEEIQAAEKLREGILDQLEGGASLDGTSGTTEGISELGPSIPTEPLPSWDTIDKELGWRPEQPKNHDELN